MATPAKKKTRLAQRTTREKILTILGRANSKKRQIKTTEDLIIFVERSKPVAFTYFRKLPDRPSGIAMCTRRLIRERVQLCIDLKLIDDKGHLTKIGTATLKSRDPNRKLASQAISFLASKNFDVRDALSAGLLQHGTFIAQERNKALCLLLYFKTSSFWGSVELVKYATDGWHGLVTGSLLFVLVITFIKK